MVKDNLGSIENSGDYIPFSLEFSKGQFPKKCDPIKRIVHNEKEETNYEKDKIKH